MEMREFVKLASRGKPSVWRVGRQGNQVVVEFGREGGKMQRTVDHVPSVGKKGTRAYVPPDEQAARIVDRLIKKKVNGGYRELVDGRLHDADVGIDWAESRLPKAFAWYKPQSQRNFVEDPELRVIATVKRDGAAFAMVVGDRRVRLYSAGLDDVSEWFPAHLEEWALASLPKRSIFLGEMVMADAEGKDCRRTLMRVTRSLPERAWRMQQELGVPTFYVWGATHIHGETMGQLRAGEVLGLTEKYIGRAHLPHSRPPSFLDGLNSDEALEMCIEQGWEGLVVYDADAKWGDRTFNLRGRPDRIQAWKVKPVRELDCVAVFDPDRRKFSDVPSVGSWGRGKHTGMAGSLALYLWDGEAMVHIGDAGTGLTEAGRMNIATGAPWVGVYEVAYESWNTDTRKLVQPSLRRHRTDKSVTDCTFAEQSPG